MNIDEKQITNENEQIILNELLNESIILIKGETSYKPIEIIHSIEITFKRIFYERNECLLKFKKFLIKKREEIKLNTNNNTIKEEIFLSEAKQYMMDKKLKQTSITIYRPLIK